jgi:hypothetical protein
LEEDSINVVPVYNAHITSMTVHELSECYNVAQEYQDEEDPINIQISENEENHVVEDPKLESVMYAQPLSMCKVNMGQNKIQSLHGYETTGMMKLWKKLHAYYVSIKIYSQPHFHK